MEITAQMRASQVGQNLIMSANGLAKNWPNIKADGLPAQASQPAVTGAEICDQLGTANVTILDAMAAANPQT